ITSPYADESNFDVTSDGENFFVVWPEYSYLIYHGKQERRGMGPRLPRDGTSRDLSPAVIDTEPNPRPDRLPAPPFAGFDGTNYYVVWQKRRIDTPGAQPYRTWVSLRRIAPDGTLPGRRKRFSTRFGAHQLGDGGVTDTRFACRTGSCLFTYKRAGS